MKNQDIFRGYIVLEDKFQVRSSAEWTEKGEKAKRILRRASQDLTELINPVV